MSLVAAKAVPGHYVDTSSPCSDPVIAAVKAAGYLGIARYVPLPEISGRLDISPGELARITGAGLACWLVQHVRFPGWDPGKHDGACDAQAAILAARAAGYPAGAHLWLDLEGITGSSVSTAAFAGAWQSTVRAAGYLAALYVGYAIPMGAADLYMLPGMTSYWSDSGNRQVATRGCAIHQQQPEIKIGGLNFDPNVVAPDRLGDLPMVCVSAPLDVA